MIIKAFVGTINVVPSKDGPHFRMTFSTTDLPADVFGMLSKFSGKAVTLEVVPGDEQLELFQHANARNDDADDGNPPDEGVEGPGPENPEADPPGGWTPPGWNANR